MINRPSQPYRRVSPHIGSCAAFRSQIRSQHSTQQVQQPASQGRDAEQRVMIAAPAATCGKSAVCQIHRPLSDICLMTRFTAVHTIGRDH
jgi:hypothetical protein